MDTEKAHERLTLTLDALTATALAGAMHLALKHPLFVGPSSRLIKSFREQLLSKLGETGFLSHDEIQAAFDMAEVEVSQEAAIAMWKERF